MLLQMAEFHFFLWLSDIPLYTYVPHIPHLTLSGLITRTKEEAENRDWEHQRSLP